MVDDSDAIRARIIAIVDEVHGVEIHEARDGVEALELVRSHAPDVVLLDLHMPGSSGLSVLPDIRAASPSSVVIVLTNHPTEHHRRQCESHGADYFFDKATDFAHVVQSLVRRMGDRL